MTLNYNIKLRSLSQGQVASFFSSVVSPLTLKTLTPYPEHTPWTPRAPFLRVPPQRLQAGDSSGRGGKLASVALRARRRAEGATPPDQPSRLPRPGSSACCRDVSVSLGQTSFRAPQARFAEGDALRRLPLLPAADVPARKTMRLPWARNAESGGRSVGACSHGDAECLRTRRISGGAGPAHPRLSDPRKHEARELRLGSTFLSAATESSTILFFKGILPLRKDAGRGGKFT